MVSKPPVKLFRQNAKKFKNFKKKQSNINNNECSICLSSICSYDLHITPCNHSFHKNCLNIWKTYGNQTCPYCRQQLSLIKNTHTQVIRETHPIIIIDTMIIRGGVSLITPLLIIIVSINHYYTRYAFNIISNYLNWHNDWIYSILDARINWQSIIYVLMIYPMCMFELIQYLLFFILLLMVWLFESIYLYYVKLFRVATVIILLSTIHTILYIFMNTNKFVK